MSAPEPTPRRPWRPWRHPVVLRFAAFLLSSYLGFTINSLRWRLINPEPIRALGSMPQGFVLCFWHGVIPLSIACKRVLSGKRAHAMISMSSDGEFIAQTVERLGFPAVRGSRADAGRDKGGAAAFRHALRIIRGGEIVAITPDGPSGPAEVFPIGPVLIARLADSPVFLVGLAVSPAVRFNTWDSTALPLPFGRACMVVDGPCSPPIGRDPSDVEAAAARFGARLRAAQRRAEAVAAGKRDPGAAD